MSDYIFGSAFDVWKSELDAINQEARLLLAAARQSSVKEDRRALQNQYAALVERRNIAIRKLLHSAFPRRYSIANEKPKELTGQDTCSTDAAAFRLNRLSQAGKETAALSRNNAWAADKLAEDGRQRIPDQGIDKNVTLQPRKPEVHPDGGFEGVLATAQDTFTRASRTIIGLLGIKDGGAQEARAVEHVEHAAEKQFSCAEGLPIEPSQASVSTTDAVAGLHCALEVTNEALSKPTLDSDLDDELLQILCEDEPNSDLDEVIRGLSRENSNTGPEIGSLSISNFGIAQPAFQPAPISARMLPLCRVQFRPRNPTADTPDRS